MNALPGFPNVYPLHPAEAAFTAYTASNGTFPPSIKDAIQARELAEAAPFWTDENAPHVNSVSLAPPPQWAARRRQMRRDALMVIASAIGFIALIGFAMTPDTAVVQAQMEDAQ